MKLSSIFLLMLLILLSTSQLYAHDKNLGQVYILKDSIFVSGDKDSIMNCVEDESILINSSTAAKKYANVSRAYDSKVCTQKVTKAAIFRAGSSKPELLPEAQIQDINFPPLKELDLYNSYRITNINFANLKPGDRIEYRIETQYNSSIGGVWGLTYTADAGAVKEGMFQVTVPKNMKLNYSASNSFESNFKPTEKIKGDEKIYTWNFKNSPPYQEEPSMVPLTSFAPKVIASTLSNWDQVATVVNKELTPAFTLNKSLKAMLAEETANMTQAEKVEKIYSMLYEKFTVIYLPYSLTSYRFNSPDQTYNLSTITSSDAAVLLTAFLKEVGVDARVALVSSKSMSKVAKNVPSLNQFDTVLVAVYGIKKQPIWLDGLFSSNLVPYLLPTVQGCDAFVINGNSGEFVVTPVSSPQDNLEELYSEIRLTSDGSAEGVLKMQFYGPTATLWTNMYKKFDDSQKNGAAKVILGRISERTSVLEQSTLAPNSIAEPFSIYIRYLIFNMLKPAGNYFECTIPMPDNKDRAALLKFMDTRKFNLDMGHKLQEDKQYKINLPENLKIKELPKNVFIDNDVALYQMVCEGSGNKIYCRCRIMFKKSEVTPEELPLLRETLQKSLEAESRKIILEKIK